MASFTFTSNSNSVLVDIDGKQAPFGDKELHPYTADRSGDIVYLYDATGILKNLGNPGNFQYNNKSKDRIPIQIGNDTVDVDGTTVFADAGALFDALRAIFFLSNTGNPLIPEGQEVNTFQDLPDPVVNDGQYWLVNTESRTGSVFTFNRRIYDPGIYKAVGGVWEYRGPDVPAYFVDDELTFIDDADNTKNLGFQLDQLSTATRRIATWQDKDITVAGLSDLQIIKVDVTTNFQLSGSTTYPNNALIRLQNRSGSSWDITTTGLDTIEGEASQTIFDGETFDLSITGTDFRL